MVMYYGSMTEPGCTENVTWLINLRPHVILPEQVKQLKSLLSTKSIPDLNEKDGGNYRDIQTLSEGRKVYSFDNQKNHNDNLKLANAALALKAACVLAFTLIVL